MDALLLVLGVGVALIIAYFTYGRWVAARVFQLRKDTATPATVLCDNSDYCPTPKSIVFGHHFTSIAGTGPIVGPAIAVMWGWLPAVLWVLIGSIFIGAVHDLGSLVVSMRNKGRSVGDIAGDLLGPRVRLIFLVVLVMALWVVLAIFGLVVASVLRQYPGAIFPVLVQIPLAIAIGLFVHRHGKNIVVPSIIALALMYASVIWGDWGPLHTFNETLAALPMWAWVVGLLAYSYIASVLPVWVLLQPRDYINALQLISALGLIVVGLVVAASIGGAPSPVETDSAMVLAEGQGHESANDERMASPERRDHGTSEFDRPKLEIVAPVVNWQPEGAPPLLPVLFITIACGAVSGFHCLVGSGTTSKQIQNELDAKAVGYGSMLTEAILATLVIAACAAGIGLGIQHSFHLNVVAPPADYGEPELLDQQFLPLKDNEYLVIQRRTGEVLTRSAAIPPFPPFFSSYTAQMKFDDGRIAEIHYGPSHDDSTFALSRGFQWFRFDDGAVAVDEDSDYFIVNGRLAFNKQYESWASAQGLANTVGAFVEGAANFIKSIGVSGAVAVALMGVLVASFAGTTMDTACRLQRYVIQELARTFLPRPPSSACHRCGYDLKGLGSDSRAMVLSEGQGHESANDERMASPEGRDHGTPESPSSITCPECGAVNRWHLETASHPDERAPETFGWDAIEKHASALNPFKWLATRHGATMFAVVTAAALAGLPAPGQSWSLANFGQGGLILWPLFGATNQLLGGLAFLVIGAWLIATKRPWWFIALPAVFMLVVPAWALVWQGFIGNASNQSWVDSGRWVLVGVAGATIILEVWLVIEVALRAAKSRDGSNAAPAP